MSTQGSQKLKAVYHTGTFVPKAPCELPEGAEVELTVQGPFLLSASATDAKEKTRILQAVIQRMQANPIPGGAPRLSREALHERG